MFRCTSINVFSITFLFQIVLLLCFYLQDFHEIVRLLLVAGIINGLLLIVMSGLFILYSKGVRVSAQWVYNLLVSDSSSVINVWNYDTFYNISGIGNYFTNYLKESCW